MIGIIHQGWVAYDPHRQQQQNADGHNESRAANPTPVRVKAKKHRTSLSEYARDKRAW